MMLLTKHPLSHSEKITIVTACSLSINKDGHLNNTGNPLSFISNLFSKKLQSLNGRIFKEVEGCTKAPLKLSDLIKPPTCLRKEVGGYLTICAHIAASISLN